jgi:hypothetical protein
MSKESLKKIVLFFCVSALTSNLMTIWGLSIFSLNSSLSGTPLISNNRDLVERAPLYLSNDMRLHKKHWIIEKKIFDEYEFQAWELYAYLSAKSVSSQSLDKSEICSNWIRNGIELDTFQVKILKGSARAGYSTLSGTFKLVLIDGAEKLNTDQLVITECSTRIISIIATK